MVRMILNSHFTLINTGGACIEGKQVWAHVMIMLSEWYFSFFINHDYMNSILIYGVCLLWYLMNWFVMRLSGITIVIELAPPPYPLPQLEYIYQAQELGCRIVGFSIICSRAQQWLKLEIVSVFLFIAIKPMFRSFKKGYSYIVCPKIYPEFIFCLIVWYL